MRHLGIALTTYAAEYEDNLPPHLVCLHTEGLITDPKLFVDRRTKTTPPTLPADLPPKSDWRPHASALDGHCDFIYTFARPDPKEKIRLAALDPNTILLYASAPTTKGYLVLFADCHVETLDTPTLTSRFHKLNTLRKSHNLPPLPTP
jgi:hypothetical protein